MIATNPQSPSPGPYGTYSPESVETWRRIADRNRARDRVFLPRIARYFRPGSVLELGAACGQLSQILQERGWDVTASDYQPFFVEHMKSIGLDSLVVDATDIARSTDRKFDNVLAQALSPQMYRDVDTTLKTYRSIHGALEDGGRFVSICGVYTFRNRREGKQHYYSLEEHLDNIRKADCFNVVRVIPHHVVPSRLYNGVTRHVLNAIDFLAAKIICNRYIFVLEKR